MGPLEARSWRGACTRLSRDTLFDDLKWRTDTNQEGEYLSRYLGRPVSLLQINGQEVESDLTGDRPLSQLLTGLR